MFQNRLALEKSLYLRQHGSNPVDWYPWGDEAFAKAKREDKPIFLSIGYSTCHWCHVMERESFEDRDVAELMNEIFVSIKVDREERPDVDSVYMKVCQIVAGRGGWPLTILMTPDKKPFFAGTYIPKSSRGQQIGMLELIPRIGELWKKKRATMLESADKIIQFLQRDSSTSGGQRIGENTLHLAYRLLAQSFDTKHAGFGQAPKFPTPHTLLFLLRYWRRKGIPFALEMVEKTLRSMRQGGIFDHVGYGFHRYATDSRWQLPHFEKMLYDQALLAMAYTEAFQATKNWEYKHNAEEIFTYVLRDMTAPEGGFYAAEDADSEDEEGKYYTWTWQEIQDNLTSEEFNLATSLFHVEQKGNFSEEATGERQGRNVLFISMNTEEFADREHIEKEELEKKLTGLREKLYALRQKRIRPLRDTKILTDWNGLMIAALAKAAQALSRPDLAEAAARASRFLLQRLRSPDGGLFHTHCDGESKIEGFADDYAFLIWGLIDLYEATFEAAHLQTALELNQYFLDHFWDEKKGGFHFTPSSREPLFIRQKESFDGAVPSSNSVAMLNFLRLGRMTANAGLEDKAWQIGTNFAPDIAASPSAYTMMLCAADFALGPSHEIVIIGVPEGKDTAAMLKSLREEFLPNKVVLFLPEKEKEAKIRKLAPFTDSLRAIRGKATAYVCSHFACQKPTTDIKLMRDSLGLSA